MVWVETSKGMAWHRFDKDGVSVAYVSWFEPWRTYTAHIYGANEKDRECQTPEMAMAYIDRYLEDTTR